MQRIVLFTLLMMSLLLTSTLSFAAKQEVDKLYQRQCVACHGEKGDGDGPAAYLLSPKPRDFTSGVFKFRSTPSGSPPTDQDLLRTLKHGINGTSMPAWDRLSDKELTDIIKYVKSFSDIFDDKDAIEKPIVIKSPPKMTKKSVRAGRKVYKEQECSKCHGAKGKGDGPSSAKLKDDMDRPIRPYDFTRGPSLMKGGTSAEDIYRTFMTGLDGTPMPSFIDELTEQKRWQLVHYIQSLSPAGTEAVAYKGAPTLKAAKSSTDPSLNVDDPIWKKSAATLVPLRPLWARDSWVESMKVQVVAGPKQVAFRLEWRDHNNSKEVIRPQDFRDAIAVQYVPQGSPDKYIGIPFIGMGDDKDTVAIWHWKADWQADIKDGFNDVDKKYGTAMNKMLPQASRRNNKTYLPGRAAGNLISSSTRTTPIEVLAAKGFGTLTSAPAAEQTVEGNAMWRDGVWVVIMRQARNLTALSGKKKTFPVAFAAWDGSAGDRNGQKSVSQWLELKFE